ncbi:hypothetical protein [Nocardiopsis rhodophaea]|uniref:hypothetical protein n=1 Tax=Nocardiopsis rhodophaea TaxID=280238 RepID=UPI0031DB428C
MSSSSSPQRPDHRPRHGFLAWAVFILAVGSMLALIGGCMTVLYAPLFTGG